MFPCQFICSVRSCSEERESLSWSGGEDLHGLEHQGELVDGWGEQDPGEGVGGGQEDVDHKLAEPDDHGRHDQGETLSAISGGKSWFVLILRIKKKSPPGW